MRFLTKSAIPAAVSILLAACGGGGGSDEVSAPSTDTGSNQTNPQPQSPAPVSFGGVAAIGAPLANANVEIICSSGEAATKTDSKGVYQFDNVAVVLPCLVTAQGRAEQSQHTTFGLASQANQNVNATTFTSLVLQSALGVNALSEINNDKLKELQGQDMVASLNDSWKKLSQELSEAYGNDIFKNINPFEKFEADPTVSEIDKALEIAKSLAGKNIEALYVSEKHAQKVAADEAKRQTCTDTSNLDMGQCWRATAGVANGYQWIDMSNSSTFLPSTKDSVWFNIFGQDFNIFKYDEYWAVSTLTASPEIGSTSHTVEATTTQACVGPRENNALKKDQIQHKLSLVSPEAQMVTQTLWAESIKKPHGINLFFQKNCLVYGGDANDNFLHEDMAYIKFTADGQAALHHTKAGQAEVVTPFTRKQINDWLFNEQALEVLGESWYATPFYRTLTEDGETFNIFAMQLYKKPRAAGSAQVEGAFLVEGEGRFLGL